MLLFLALFHEYVNKDYSLGILYSIDSIIYGWRGNYIAIVRRVNLICIDIRWIKIYVNKDYPLGILHQYNQNTDCKNVCYYFLRMNLWTDNIGSILWCSNRSISQRPNTRANKPCRKGKLVSGRRRRVNCMYSHYISTLLHKQKYGPGAI